MLSLFGEGFLALQRHFRGRDNLDAVDDFKVGIAISVTVGVVWLIGPLLFTVLQLQSLTP